jgi:hypothetical protein
VAQRTTTRSEFLEARFWIASELPAIPLETVRVPIPRAESHECVSGKRRDFQRVVG